MKTNVESMEEEMERLSTNMQKMEKLSSAINNTLSQKREKIHKLNGINNIITKFQFLMELPSVLKKSIEVMAYGQAVSYYKNNFPLLQRYQCYIASFKHIEIETVSIINELKNILEKRITHPNVSTGSF